MGARVERPTDSDLARFRQDLEIQKRSPYTIKHYCLVVHQFHRWVNQQRGRTIPLRAVTPADLKQYQIHLTTQRKYAKNSLYHAVKGLQSFYRFLNTTTANELRPPRRGQGLPKYLTEAEAARLRRSAVTTRDRAFVSMLLYSGVRVGELCRLTMESVDFADMTVHVRSGKGDKDRLVIVAESCLEDLKSWLKERPASGEDYIFPGKRGRRNVTERTVQRAVLKLAKTAGLEKTVTPHVLRHTLATSLLRHGGDIRFIQRILGHASIATTQVYTHLDDAELRRMYERAKPDF